MARPFALHEHPYGVPEWAVRQAELWMPVIRSAWLEKVPAKATLVIESLEGAFRCKGNPYWLALQLVLSSSDWQVSRSPKSPTLAVAIMQFFQTLVEDKVLAPAPHRIALSAFTATFLHGSNELFDLVANAFHLWDMPVACLPAIQSALAENALPIENCARAVAALGLLPYFSVRELLFPLFAQSTTRRLHELLATSEPKQREFVCFLDGLLVDELEPGLAADVEHFRAHRAGRTALNRGNLKTAVLRLAKKYKLSAEELCPNATRMQQSATLAYLLREIYVERSVPKDDWLDMVCDFVGRDTQMQQQALRFMAGARTADFATAAACARLWNLGAAQLPQTLNSALAGNWPMPTRDGRKFSSNAEKFFRLKLADSAVVFVDDRLKFDRFLMDATEAYGTKVDVVGIDCEWRPVFQASKKARLALLQVATKFSVHLLDMIALKKVLEPMHWLRLVDAVFIQNAVMKMGFSLTGDLDMMTDFDPAFCILRQGCVNLLDMSTVCQKFFKEKPEVFPYYDPKIQTGRGLTDFVKLCFGLPLDKTEQKSNWERRPLRKSQVLYAALDAFCLLEIHETLNEGCHKLDLNFNEFCKAPKAKETPPGKKTPRRQAKN